MAMRAASAGSVPDPREGALPPRKQPFSRPATSLDGTYSVMKSEEDLLFSAARKLEARILGFVFGVLGAFGMFAATAVLLLKGGREVGPHLALLGQYLWGYTITLHGAFIGAFYGLVLGYAFGYLIAEIYNGVLSVRRKRHEDG